MDTRCGASSQGFRRQYCFGGQFFESTPFCDVLQILCSSFTGSFRAQNDPGVGFSWAGIVSQRWDWGTAHFNVEANLTREQHGEVFLDVILEGPATWKVRPVVELFYDKAWLETETRSALVGAIWQVRDDLSFDAAYRYALENGRAVNEIRAGLTFAFKVESDKAPVRPGVTFGNWGLSR